MRRVLPADVARIACVLCATPEREWLGTVQAIFRGSQAGLAHHRKTGKAHPVWGTGSLMAAASDFPKAAEPDFDDDQYCRAWIVVLSELLAYRQASGRQPEAHVTQRA